MIKQNTLELINNTPLVKLDKLETDLVIYAKLEFVQPGGSIKDRAALQIIKDALAVATRMENDITLLIMTKWFQTLIN